MSRHAEFFDIDGVLVDSKTAIFEAYNWAFDEVCGISLSLKEFEEKIWGLPWEAASRMLPNKELRDLVHRIKSEKFATDTYRLVTLNDEIVEQALKIALDRNKELFVITGGSQDATYIKYVMLPMKIRHHAVLKYSLNKHMVDTWMKLRDDMHLTYHDYVMVHDDDPRCLAAADAVGFLTTQVQIGVA